ncbi:MAG: hypothetical protein ACREMN_02115 [Gemmatimonadales bacterium]
MNRIAALLLAGCMLLPARSPAQTAETVWNSSVHAWEAGDYGAALEGLERLLSGPDAEDFVDRIALLTGEAYLTTALATDGRAPRWSPAGDYAAYETGAAGPETRTHLVRVERGAARPAGEVAGYGLTFSRSGVAYLSLPATPEIQAGRRELDSLIEVRAFAAWRRRAVEILGREAELARIVVRDLGRNGLARREREVAAPGLRTFALRYVPASDQLILTGAPVEGDAGTTDLYALAPGAPPRALTEGSGRKTVVAAAPGAVVYTIGNDRVAAYPTWRRTGTASSRERRPRYRPMGPRWCSWDGPRPVTRTRSTWSPCAMRPRHASWCARPTASPIQRSLPTGGASSISACPGRIGSSMSWRSAGRSGASPARSSTTCSRSS